ncbi:metabolite traffic protein EboE [Antarcticibacterium sp. 1MA-6-2]|uniref:metabolite traffic protein EboE n=1 Tax=Antarcticibacterium sp. 1MA-6-2 TaxID=2908210 RepID=UPI001F1E00B1|nr:metabolite traffic protein EboE [Antarcticibacterium sp. 1MA-6-2]UJH90700.1 metabolite traffic protein EboE [Antarcticibacterium sp. 1MA-6-2]
MYKNGYHLTYCTNIHPGESWEETFENLKNYIPKVKTEVSPDAAFGIGLRLSNDASISLKKEKNLSNFKHWLIENDCYVFTMNGFPFGGFHHQAVKDQVHYPDWTTTERLDYTLRLFDILNSILPEGMEGGISTSPLSYKYWEAASTNKQEVFENATLHMVKVAERLYHFQENEGKTLHLDIEPEPDGLLENTQGVIEWYRNWLIPMGTVYLKEHLDLSAEQAEACLKNHIRLCYDVCHFAIVYEKPAQVFSLLEAEGIKIGKVQISAALKADLHKDIENRTWLKDAFAPFVESTYLHQVVEKDVKGFLTHYPDLPQALENVNKTDATQWRTHFHVPVFLSRYGQLQSTQEDILDVLNHLKNEKTTRHLEVETYTWEVLPNDIQLEIVDSIVRELKWVQKNF